MDHIHIIMTKQGTQSQIPFDEQPSLYNVYEHSIPRLYARHVKGLHIENVVIRQEGTPFPMWTKEVQLEHCINVQQEIGQ